MFSSFYYSVDFFFDFLVGGDVVGCIFIVFKLAHPITIPMERKKD